MNYLPNLYLPLTVPLLLASLGASQVLGLQQNRWELPPLENRISIRDGKTDQRIDWSDFIDDLAQADIVFLGETHDDDTTHELQLAVYQALLEAQSGQVVLAMEMFERDVQPKLDQYLSGQTDESTFLTTSRPWGNYAEAYRPLVEAARDAGRPVIAANFPRPLLMRVNQGGLEGLGDERQFAPQELFPNSDLYWKRADNATRSHSMFMAVQTDPESRLMSTQSLWDNSMGEACAVARQEYPDHLVLHLNGGFHTQYWDGTVAQVRHRDPVASIKTVAITPALRPHSAQLEGEPVADYVVFVENRAKNLNDGKRKVIVGRENAYLLHVPDWASADRPAPLLIWLSDDGLSPQDNMAFWKGLVGQQAAIAIIEPTHRQQERDMSLSGRWFWPDTFPQDIGAGIQTVEGTWQYLLNRFPIDPSRVCLAGKGTGATVASAAAMLTSRMDVQAVAFTPRQYTKIKDFPLPLKEDWGTDQPPSRRLVVVGNPQDQNWWTEELAEYSTVGIETEWATLDDDLWRQQPQQRAMILACLGVEDQAVAELGAEKKYLVAEQGSAKEMHWLRMLAEKLSDDQTQVAVVTRSQAQAIQKSSDTDAQPVQWTLDRLMIVSNLPLCPGPFGGTTVLVLNAEQAADLEAWLELETNDPLNQRSRFHRLRIALADTGTSADTTGTVGAERNLAAVLEKLLNENRKNVLIVPAQFYASDGSISLLTEQAAEFEDQMTLQWLPGLGGSLQRLVGRDNK